MASRRSARITYLSQQVQGDSVKIKYIESQKDDCNFIVKESVHKIRMSEIKVLALDVKRTGYRTTDQTIAIDISVVNSDYVETDCCLYTAWDDSECIFEEEHWKEYWSENSSALRIIKLAAGLHKCDTLRKRQEQIIKGVIKFIEKQKKIYDEKNTKLILVVHNASSTVYWLNALITEFMPFYRPLPHCFTDLEIRDVKDIQYGRLLSLDKEAARRGEEWESILDKHSIMSPQSYRISLLQKDYNHLPGYNAYKIALDAQMWLQLDM